MTTTTQTHGGGAQPASIDTSGKVTGGAALRVYGFDSEADAIAAGYICEGGPAMSVALITDAQLASGTWRLEGDPSGTAVYTAPSNMPVEGGYAVPVYPVNGWGSAPAPVGPQFSAAEIGTVNASTVAVTFDQDVSASDYAAGATIKVNGSAETISSATRQTNHAIVYYALSAAVVFGDTVTWEYAEASGNIVAEDDSTPLANVTAQSVTNNVARIGPAPLLDLQADRLYLTDGDPVSTWADRSGNGRNFTQTGTARPIKQTIGGYAAVVFDGSNDCMSGGAGAWIDDLESFTVITVITYTYSGLSVILGKILNSNDAPGWYVNIFGSGILVQETGGSNYLLNSVADIPHGTNKIVSCAQLTSLVASTTYVDFDGGGTPSDSSSPPVASYASPDSLLLGCYTDTSGSGFLAASLHAVRIYAPALSPADRTAVEAELIIRYGITPPVPFPPQLVAAEIGTANASTVHLTFDQNVNAAGDNYSAGVTIKVNGSVRTLNSGFRPPGDHTVVYYALSSPVVFGDTVTWEYAAASGFIVAEDDSTPLADVSARSVTNNVAP